MSAGRKEHNMSPFCQQKGTEFVHSLPAERGPGLLFTSTPYTGSFKNHLIMKNEKKFGGKTLY